VSAQGKLVIFEPWASWCEEFLEACGNLSGLGETCQPAVSKHYRKEMQGDCGPEAAAL